MDSADAEQPSIARIYDYVLGGSANFEVERSAAQVVLDAFPGERDYAYINRDFLRRSVAALCEAGIDQFLDLGSGIPTVGNVHEIAARGRADTRVAYVDIDPVAVHHARDLLGTSYPTVAVTEADIRDPAALVAAYRDACAPGSALVITNGCQLAATDAEIAAFRAVLAQTPTPTMNLRGPDEVATFFAGYELLDPGIVPSAAWRPDREVSDEYAARSNSLGAVGVLRG